MMPSPYSFMMHIWDLGICLRGRGLENKHTYKFNSYAHATHMYLYVGMSHVSIGVGGEFPN